jgi:hypothetical protein
MTEDLLTPLNLGPALAEEGTYDEAIMLIVERSRSPLIEVPLMISSLPILAQGADSGGAQR